MSMDDVGGVVVSTTLSSTGKKQQNVSTNDQELANEEQFEIISPSVSNNAPSTVKPRVSFNRDVHVKRIELRESPDTVPALSGVGPGLGQSNTNENTGTRLLALPVRREKLGHLSRRQLAEEAAKVLKQADSVHCVSNRTGSFPEKFYSLPSRKKNRFFQNESPNSSTERKLTRRRHSEELGSTTSITLPDQIAPKKPPRTFLTRSVSDASPRTSDLQPTRPKRSKKNSFKNLFKKSTKVKRSKSDVSEKDKKNITKVNRSHSDVSDKKTLLRKRSGSITDETLSVRKKSQLSPIIEVSPTVEHSSVKSKDYFSLKSPQISLITNSSDKENQPSNNIELVKPPERKKWKKQISNKIETNWQKTPENSIVVIDVDNAEDILTSRKNPLRKSFEDRIKSLTKRKGKKTGKEIEEVDSKNSIQILKDKFEEEIKKRNNPINENMMIHSSQKPVDRIPLTRGHTVDHMVKRLSHERFSPPPKTPNVLVTPKLGMNHNNNLPFSYTKPSISPISDTEYNNNRNSLSSDRPEYQSPNLYRYETRSPYRPLSPKIGTTFDEEIKPQQNGQIIYAQVVCGTPETKEHKQTIHRSYNQKTKVFTQNSDSDEGLGYEEYGKIRLESKNNSFNDDLPITPKYQSNGGFTTKKEYTSNFVDTTVLRGRADGMDTAKRRESLTELLNNDSKINERNDLSSRRELLESRINSRNKLLQNKFTTTETKSKYYQRNGSPPTGFIEKFTSESYLDENGDVVTSESRTKEKILDHNRNNRIFSDNYNNNKIIKEFHKSNPELIAQKRYEDVLEQRRNNRTIDTSYHDSLKRNKNKYDNDSSMIQSNSKDKFVDSGIENDFRRDSERRIQRIIDRQPVRNDSEDEGFQSSLLIAVEKQHTEDNHERRKYTSEYYRKERRSELDYMDRSTGRREYDESDVGGREIDSDREITKYTKTETLQRNKKSQPEYVPRERSIDDGSHYDPRIDKDLDKNGRKIDTKPPKAEKKISSLDKVKNLFSSKKSKEKRAAKAINDQLMVDEDEMRARYSEYKGSKQNLDMKQEVDYSKRKKLTTPRSSRSPTPERIKEPLSTRSNNTSTLTRSTKQQQLNKQNQQPSNNWFKSLDRITRKNKKTNLVLQSDISKISETENSDPECSSSTLQQKPQKNLRFFGDTDVESNNDSIRQKSSTFKHRPSLNSTLKRTSPRSHKNLNDIDEQIERKKDTTKLSGKPPVSPYEPRITRARTSDTLDGRRRTNNGSDSTLKRLKRNDSLVESSTEGDSSQQSQRSVVYLHAATVGDIPGPGDFARRRGTSREELSSIASSRVVTPQVKTLSRSFSVLAPWKPRHYRESYNIDYSQQPTPSRSKSSTSTVKSKIESKNNSRNGGSTSTLNRRSKSKDNVSTLSRKSQSRDNVSKSKDDISSNRSTSTLNRKSKSSDLNDRKTKSKDNLSSSTLNRRTKDSTETMYKKNEKTTHGNKKSMSLESLGNNNRRNSNSDKEKEKRDRVSRSVSMPKEKSAGWFSKKSSKK